MNQLLAPRMTRARPATILQSVYRSGSFICRSTIRGARREDNARQARFAIWRCLPRSRTAMITRRPVMSSRALGTSSNRAPTRPANSRLEERLEQFARHEQGALARLITLVENRRPEASTIIERIYPMTGHAHVIGITGPPGAGKSTLVNLLIAKYRALGKKVAVLAIDPSSPFSGGAVLGDRVRMTDHYKDQSVYIRSLSSRGSHGGLSRSAREIVKLLDAFGHDVIIIETVGVGQ